MVPNGRWIFWGPPHIGDQERYGLLRQRRGEKEKEYYTDAKETRKSSQEYAGEKEGPPQCAQDFARNDFSVLEN